MSCEPPRGFRAEGMFGFLHLGVFFSSPHQKEPSISMLAHKRGYPISACVCRDSLRVQNLSEILWGKGLQANSGGYRRAVPFGAKGKGCFRNLNIHSFPKEYRGIHITDVILEII